MPQAEEQRVSTFSLSIKKAGQIWATNKKTNFRSLSTALAPTESKVIIATTRREKEKKP